MTNIVLAGLRAYWPAGHSLTGWVGAAGSIACHPLTIRMAGSATVVADPQMSGTSVHPAVAWEPAIACQRERQPRCASKPQRPSISLLISASETRQVLRPTNVNGSHPPLLETLRVPAKSAVTTGWQGGPSAGRSDELRNVKYGKLCSRHTIRRPVRKVEYTAEDGYRFVPETRA